MANESSSAVWPASGPMRSSSKDNVEHPSMDGEEQSSASVKTLTSKEGSVKAVEISDESESPTISLSEESDFEKREDSLRQRGLQRDNKVKELRERYWAA
eukprot:1798592-Karenia_brevis.AAC.1